MTPRPSRGRSGRGRDRELVKQLRERGWSLRRIGKRLGVADGTVRTDLSESGAQNCAPPTVEGSDGKSYPARVERRERIAAMWLACYTQEEIGAAVGVSRPEVTAECQELSETEALPKLTKLLATHEDPDWKPPPRKALDVSAARSSMATYTYAGGAPWQNERPS